MFYDVNVVNVTTLRCLTIEEVSIVIEVLTRQASTSNHEVITIRWFKEETDKHTLGSWGWLNQGFDHVTAANKPYNWGDKPVYTNYYKEDSIRAFHLNTALNTTLQARLHKYLRDDKGIQSYIFYGDITCKKGSSSRKYINHDKRL